jgi:uncharacterized protein (DUF2141 family)
VGKRKIEYQAISKMILYGKILRRKMKKLYFVFSLSIALLSVNMAFSQDGYKISGEVQYVGAKNIFVCLYNQETWPNYIKELPPVHYTIITKSNQSGKANFAFSGVPKGDYVIVVFIDENDNGIRDRDTMGWPTEPSRIFKPSSTGHANWNDCKFLVDKDITGLSIQF